MHTLLELLPTILFVWSSKCSFCNVIYQPLQSIKYVCGCVHLCVCFSICVCVHPPNANLPLRLSHYLKILQKQKSQLQHCPPVQNKGSIGFFYSIHRQRETQKGQLCVRMCVFLSVCLFFINLTA